MQDRENTIREIARQFRALKHKMMSVTCFNHEKFHITPAQWHILFLVKEHDGISSKDVAKSQNISSSAATQLIDGLVSKDFLIREYDQDDRRLLKIHLSKTTKKFVDDMRIQSHARLNTIFECLSDDELQDYLVLNGKIVNRFLEEENCQK
jgi:DNA-binding MarR family transcriptional regulator